MAKTLVIKGANFSANALDTVQFEESVPCTGISLDKSVETITGIGNTTTIIATALPSDTTDVIMWNTSDPTVITVSNGVVMAVGLGTATITAQCGNYSNNCSITVEVVPNYVVIGAVNPHRASAASTNAFINVVGTGSTEYKYGGIGYVTTDASVRTIDRTGVLAGDYRLCPIPLPDGANKVKIESKMYSGSTLLTFKPRFTWFDSTQPAGSDYSGAKVLDGLGSDSTWDETDFAQTVTIDVPATSGIDSFAVAIYMSDWSLLYNTDYAQYFDVTIL